MVAACRRPRGFRRKYQAAKPFGMFSGVGQTATFPTPGYDLFYQQHMQPVPGFNSPGVTSSPSMMLFDSKDHYSAPYDIKPFYPPCGSDTTATPNSYAPPVNRGYDNMSNYLASQTGFMHPYNFKPYTADCNAFSNFTAHNSYVPCNIKPAVEDKTALSYDANDTHSTPSTGCVQQKPFMASFNQDTDSVNYGSYIAARDCVDNNTCLNRSCGVSKMGERTSLSVL